jgi:hypothetical protein
MICAACQENVHPVQELQVNGRGFSNRCPRVECGAPMPVVEPRDVQADGSVNAAVREPGPSPRALAVAAAPVSVIVEQPAVASLDILGSARARLSTIEQQLASVDKLQAEARRLRAMIAAAEAAESN